MGRSLRILLVASVLMGMVLPSMTTPVQAQTPTADVTVAIGFNPGNIALQAETRLTITINNADATVLTSAAFTNTFPAGMTLADPPNTDSNCSGTVTATGGAGSVSLSGGTVPAGGSCYVKVSVRSSVSGTLTNTINAGDVTGNLGASYVSNDAPASATLTVATFDFNAEINKQFNPINISPGDVSRMSVNIYNSNTFQLDNASWTDNLIGVQPGLYIADPPNVSTVGCGTPTVTAVANGTELALDGATVPAKVGTTNGVCSVFVDVSSVTPGNLINTVPSGNLNSTAQSGTVTVSNTDPASATIQVDAILPPSVTKAFAPNTVWVGQNSRLTIEITNTDNSHTIDEVALTDVLPANILLATTVNPSLSGCGVGASLSAVSGTGSLSLSDAEIPPSTPTVPSICRIQVDVVSSVPGEYTNTIPAGDISTRQGVTNANEAQADLNVQAAGISKSFSPSPILAGATSTLTITLRNPTGDVYTGVSIDDVMPGADLYLIAPYSTTCGAGVVSIETTNRADDTLRLTGGSIPAGTVASPSTCTITGTVTTAIGAPDVTHTNEIPANSLSVTSHPGVTNILPASANLNIDPLSIDLVKSFSPTEIQQNGTSTVTIQLRNPTASIVHVTSLTDTLPAGLTAVAGTGATTCNNGTVTITPTQVTLAGAAEIPAGTIDLPGTCTYSFDVTAATATTFANSLGANSLTTGEGISNLGPSNTVNLVVYATGYGMIGSSKSFNNSVIMAGSTSRLSFRLDAPLDMAITGLIMTDVLPSGVTVSSVPSTAICGGTLSAPVGTDTISLTGASIALGGNCQFDVYVTASASGIYANSIDNDTQIDNDQDQHPPSDLNATLTVTDMTIRKAFYPDEVAPNGRTTLTVTFENTNPAPLISLSASDNLNTMNQGALNGTEFRIASPSNASTTCAGGSVTATPGSTVFSISGGTVPGQVGAVPGICTLEVDVIASGPFTSPIVLPITGTNRLRRTSVSAIISGVGTSVRPLADATDALTVTPLEVGVVKGFDPLTVFGGSSSTMSVQLINPNTSSLTGIAFTDVMPSGMFIADPPNFNVGTCSGTITGTAGSDTFVFSGGTLPPGKRCTLTLSATMNVNGNRTNVIPAGGVTTFNGAESKFPAAASLTNLPGASISKHFTPAEITLGEPSLLTISIKNTGNIPLSNMGLTDTLPPGLTIAASPAPTNACGGLLTADSGTAVITLGAGAIAAGPDTTCDITVPIDAAAPGSYTNTIVTNSLSTTEGATNTEPAEDTLIVRASPSMQLVKSLNVGASDPLPYLTGDTLSYNLVVTNTGDINLTNVTLSDPDLPVLSCLPVQPSTLAPAASMTCTGSYMLTAADETAGSHTNIATSDSDQTDPVTDSVTVPTNQSNLLTINKEILTVGPYEIGDTINYAITVTNEGAAPLTNVSVSDPDATVGVCIPPQPVASLAAGASIVCPATYEIVQADVDAESFTNTATADSDETDPVDDSVTIPVEDNASMEVHKQVISTGPYNTVGKRIEYDISAVNTGDQTLTNVTITDPGVDVVLGACTPAQPATLATGEILSCYAYHDVTAGDITAGGFSNTAIGTSDQTPPVTDTVEVVTQTPSIQLEKTGVLNDGGNGRADTGDVINYTFTVTNTGEVTLNNIDISDIIGGVTISGGPIATMAPAAVDNSTFTGSYTLTQADIDAGTFHNYASVTGYPPVGSVVSDVDDDIQTLTAAPSILLAKSGAFNDANTNSQADAGETITYSFTVTNTGNVTLTNITLADAGITLSGGPIASLAPGASDNSTFSGTYAVTQTNIDAGVYNNTATVTGTPPTGDDVTDDSSHAEPLPQIPGIELVKTGTLVMTDVAPIGRPDVGDRITYTFTVNNTGNTTLNNVTITDPDATILGGPITLAPGASDTTTFTGTHTLTQADLDAGTFTNTATTSGNVPSGGSVNDTDPDTQTLPADPSITLDKTGTLNDGGDGVVDAGDTITYVFTVTNTGNVTLTNVTVTDPDVTVSGGPISMAAGAVDNTTFTGTYTLTQTDVDAGTFTNIAGLSGNPPTGAPVTDSDDDTQTLTPGPSIELVKTGTLNLGANSRADAGDTITYAFTVTNTGNVTLTGVTVTDPDVTVSGGPITLAPGVSDSTTFTGTYTLTQIDVDAGTFTNIAGVSGNPPTGAPVTDSDDDTQTLPRLPSIELVKTGTLNLGANSRADAGDTITYTFTVTNTGNVTLTGVTVTDPNVTVSGGPITLAPGVADSTTFTGTYTLTQPNVDAGTFTNTASTSGTPPSGGPVGDTDSDTQTLPAVPSIDLQKTGTLIDGGDGRADVGDTIAYVFTIENTGNVTLAGVTVTDTIGGVTVSGGPITLIPGAVDNSSITGSYTLTQADVDAGSFYNSATVSGNPPVGAPVTDPDDHTETLTPDPAIDLQKTGVLNDGGDGRVDAGDTITYTFTVTNTGNVTLTNVTVADTTAGVTFSGTPIASLAPGASNNTAYTGSYILTQADVDSGHFLNQANATGTPPGGPNVTDPDDDDMPLTPVPLVELEKTGVVDMTVVPPNATMDPGDVINYSFTVTNPGNVTLTNVTVVDNTPNVTLTGSPIATLPPGGSNNTNYTATHILTQIEVDSGSFLNEATVTGTPPTGTDVTDDDDDTRPLGDVPYIGVAKRVVGDPVEVSPGTWDVTFEIVVRNYGNVTLSNVQATDDLAAIFPGAVSVVLQSITSSDLSVSSTYDGVGDNNMLDGTDSLAFEEQGTITLVVRVIPTDGGPFNNVVTATGQPPTGAPVTDDSQDGTDADPDNNGDPTDNNVPTPVDFGPNLFDPPFGQKTFNDQGIPLLQWTMVWVNNSNIVNIDVSVSDPIPVGAIYEIDGVPSGTGVPAAAPAGSTDVGVSCSAGASVLTTTTWCYFEAPTATYPRGRIVWEGALGPDLGVTDPALAVNALYIVFNMRVNDGNWEVFNQATAGSDRDGDGTIAGPNEVVVANANEVWSNWPSLPKTGFAPGVVTDMSGKAPSNYNSTGGLTLEIPSLNINVPILGVPIEHGEWNLNWLGNNVGYLENTAFPTWAGNSGLTAHNYDRFGNPGLFANIAQLSWGDQIIIHGWGNKYIYEVRTVQNWIKPEDTDSITHEEYPWVTLITCRSYDEATDSYRWRTVVRAVQVGIEPE